MHLSILTAFQENFKSKYTDKKKLVINTECGIIYNRVAE